MSQKCYDARSMQTWIPEELWEIMAGTIVETRLSNHYLLLSPRIFLFWVWGGSGSILLFWSLIMGKNQIKVFTLLYVHTKLCTDVYKYLSFKMHICYAII